MANVQVIEAKSARQLKRRVGVYVRVSTDSDDQQNSYESQIKHYTALIEKHTDWELVDVYADEGITGTKLDRRDDFLRMMRDARRGKLDTVLVKSVSRFARNTKDCLQALRELTLLGVALRFDRENLDTETLTTELMVSVSGSLAQEESISMSQNMRWSYQKRMQSGRFITCNAPFGYRLKDGKEMVICEEEAEIVRWIFDSYLDGMNLYELADAVTSTGFPTSEGTPYWQKSSISYILQNEKYIGDSLGQKSCGTDTFPFRSVDNKGQKPQYYAEGTHPAIVDKDTFERVQALIRSRRPKSAGMRGEYPLSRKIVCGNCGTVFMRRVTNSGLVMWVCRQHDKDRRICTLGRIPESEIYAAFMRMAAKLKANLSIILAPAISQLQELSAAENAGNTTMLSIVGEIASLNDKTLMLNRLREKKLLPTESFLEKNAEISNRLAELKRQRRLLLEADDEDHAILQKLRELMRIMKETDIAADFDEQLFGDITEKVIVESQELLRFRLLGGLEVTEHIRGKIR